MSTDEQNVTVSGTDVNVDTAGRLEVSGHIEVAPQSVDDGVAPQSDDKSLTIDVDPFNIDPVETVNAITDAFRNVNSDAGSDSFETEAQQSTAPEVVADSTLTAAEKQFVEAVTAMPSAEAPTIDLTQGGIPAYVAGVEQQRQRGQTPEVLIVDEIPDGWSYETEVLTTDHTQANIPVSVAGVDASANVTNDITADPTSGEDELTDEDKEMVSLELTPLDFMIRMLGIDLAMAQIYPEPVYLATDADASDLLAREGLQYSFDANRSLYLCGMADSSIEATLKDPDLRVLALRAIKFKYRRFDQPVDDAVKAVTAALRKQQHDIAAAQAAEAAAHNSVAGPQ